MVVPVLEQPTVPTPRRPLDAPERTGHDGAVARRSTRGRRRSVSVTDPEDELIRTLYEQHAASLLMFVLRLTGGDRQRAEDIVQETLLRAWRNAHKLAASGSTSVRPWLVTVARRIAIDQYRSERARPSETYDQRLDAMAVPDDTEQVLRSMTVAEALRSLNDAHREILVATYFRGRTVPEAASELGLPVGTAKSRVFYALRALRAALAKRGVTTR
jgi:RNA polymerase sigma-70 factor (ECF subfamily)